MANSAYYAFVFLGTAVFCIGLVLALRKPFYQLAMSAAKQLDIILDQSLGEREKDRRILHNLLKLLKHLFFTLCLLIILLICGALPALTFTINQANYQADTSSVYFYLSMLLGSFSLLIFRKKADYSYWSKLLHSLILDNRNLGKFLFKREVKKARNDKVIAKKPFVIVSGLARAGTTALTNLLFDEMIFHSISYANVPFLLAPKSWKKIYNPRESKKKERAHGDQVLFSENSIEALEEYFFKVFLNDSYIKENHLVKHDVSEDLLGKYYMYQDLFKQKSDTIYLAKNNNFLLRYESFVKHNNQFKLVLIFRNPIDHAKSLMNQHKKFLIKQKEDDFVLKYMNWLGHYEFGLNQKYFLFGAEVACDKYKQSDLNYWLAIWLNYYSYVNRLLNTHDIHLVHYEDLLKEPDGLKRALGISLGIELKREPQEKFRPKMPVQDKLLEADHDLLEKTDEIYKSLKLEALSTKE